MNDTYEKVREATRVARETFMDKIHHWYDRLVFGSDLASTAAQWVGMNVRVPWDSAIQAGEFGDEVLDNAAKEWARDLAVRAAERGWDADRAREEAMRKAEDFLDWVLIDRLDELGLLDN